MDYEEDKTDYTDMKEALLAQSFEPSAEALAVMDLNVGHASRIMKIRQDHYENAVDLVTLGLELARQGPDSIYRLQNLGRLVQEFGREFETYNKRREMVVHDGDGD